MRAVLVLLLVAACQTAAPPSAPQVGERPGFIQHHPAPPGASPTGEKPGFIQHYPATGHLVG